MDEITTTETTTTETTVEEVTPTGLSQIVTYARYSEGAGMASTAVSSQISSSCSGNSATATRLQEARKITFTGDAETEVKFDGSADLLISLKNKKAEKAEYDAQGNNIVKTYATKAELENYAAKSDLNDYAKASEVSDTYATKNKLDNYVSKTDFNFSFEKIDDVPYLFIEINGKKYQFIGAEVS